MDEVKARIDHYLHSDQPRIIIGIVGKPASGKSTLVKNIGKLYKNESLAIVPMDGYHLSNEVLKKLKLRNKKGAPETFDALGFTALIKRIKSHLKADIYYPIFHREIEESIANEGVVHAGIKIVVVEGNYLLHNKNGWHGVASALDESWFVDINEGKRMSRLIARHVKYGKTHEEATAWARGSDQDNAEIIGQSMKKADYIIHLG
jgi:pantothenate kinase